MRAAYGPPRMVSDYLSSRSIVHDFVHHSLYSNRKSVYERIGVRERPRQFGVVSFPSAFLGYFAQLVLTVCEVIRRKARYNVIIGVDPLNSATALILRRIGFCKYVIFYAADYAFDRFSNRVMNALYHILDRYCAHRSDYVWNVSSRITRIRSLQGVERERNLFVPNSVSCRQVRTLPESQTNRRLMIFVGHLGVAPEIDLILDTFPEILASVPDSKLLIVGSGPRSAELKKQIFSRGLASSIVMLGELLHDDVLRLLSTCAIGIALYSGKAPWTVFADSAKVREYVACGLPVIMNSTPSTADDIRDYDAGIVIPLSKKNFLEAAIKLLRDDLFYARLRTNALRMSREFDRDRILDEAFSRIDLPRSEPA